MFKLHMQILYQTSDTKSNHTSTIKPEHKKRRLHQFAKMMNIRPCMMNGCWRSNESSPGRIDCAREDRTLI